MSRARDTANQINRLNSSAADATAITVTSSENVGVGLSTNIASKLHVNSELSLGQDNNNRMIVGSTSGGVGSIGTIEGGTASFSSMTFKGGNVGIGTSNPTAKFSVTGSTSGDYLAKIESTNQFGLKIKTTSTSNSHEQFAIHDGNNNVQFKVMGGGNVYATAINLGGTGAANRLNDYEEGTFTPIFGSGFSGINYAQQHGFYTKVGNTVTIYYSLQLNSLTNTNSSQVQIGNLPFATSTSGAVYQVASSYISTSNVGSANNTLFITSPNSTSIAMYLQNSNGVQARTGSSVGSSFYTSGTLTYFTPA
jgi:hypothetical protein